MSWRRAEARIGFVAVAAAAENDLLSELDIDSELDAPADEEDGADSDEEPVFWLPVPADDNPGDA